MSRPVGTPNRKSTLGVNLIGPLLPDLIDFLASVALGQPGRDPMNRNPDGTPKAVDYVSIAAYDIKDRTDATKTLLSYGISKPAQAVAVTGGQDDDGNDQPVGLHITFAD